MTKFSDAQRQTVVAEAKRIGLSHYPYDFSGDTNKTGYDCSGLVVASWNKVGLTLPHSAADQAVLLKAVPVSGANWAKMLPGDLVFYYETDPSKVPHVALYLELFAGLHVVAQATDTEHGSEVIRANKYVPVTLLGFVGHS